MVVLQKILDDLGLRDETTAQSFLMGSPEIERGCCKICDLYLDRITVTVPRDA